MMRSRRRLVLGLLVAIVLAAAWWMWPRTSRDDVVADAIDRSTLGAGTRGGFAGDVQSRAARGGWPWQRATATVSGTITVVGGGPLPDAEVCAWSSHPDAPAPIVREPRCTTSGNDGRYAIEGLPPINVAVYASAPEHIPAVYTETRQDTIIVLRPGEERTGVDLALQSGGVKIEGVVRDLAGGTVDGALLTSRTTGRAWTPAQAVAIARSDDEGRFAMWVAPGQATVTASADGYSEAWRSGAAPGFTFELFLTPESVVVGRVVRDGTPVEGAIVNASGLDGGYNTNTVGTAITDEHGRFRIDRLMPGRYHPSATTDDGYGKAIESVHVGLSETSDEIVIELAPIASVSGIVLAGGKPCERGNVVLKGRGATSRQASGRTQADGTVMIRTVHPGEYSIEASCPAHVRGVDFAPLTVGTEPITGQTWTLEPGITARGRVVDDDGKPIAAASVSAQSIVEGREGVMQYASDVTDGAGMFTLIGITAGRFRLEAHAEGWPSRKEPVEVEIGEGGRDDLEIALHRGGTVRGSVRDANGATVSGATVRIAGRQWNAQGMTRDDGSFQIEGVEPGDHRVFAQRGFSEQMRAPGQTDDDVRGEPVHVVAAETTEVELVVERRDGKIRGRVVDATGAPVIDAFVEERRESDSVAVAAGNNRRQVRWGNWGRQPVLTDEDGNFELRELAEGRYTIRAYRRGGGEAIAEQVDTGASAVELAIEDTGSIAGTVTLASGGSPPEFSVNVHDKTSGVRQSDSFYLTNGAFRLLQLPAGTYEVNVSSDAGDASTTVELAAGQELDGVTLELIAHVTLRGRVVDFDTEEPIAGMRVNASPRKGGSRFGGWGSKGDEPNITDDEGRFELVNAPSGAIRVMVMPRSFSDDEYEWTNIVVDVPTGVDAYELPDLRAVKKRRKRADDESDLGFTLAQVPPGVEWEDHPLHVAFVRPGGPADQAGLKSGATIVAVDGHDVTGTQRYLYHSLTSVTIGTTLRLGLAEGGSVEITAGPQP